MKNLVRVFLFFIESRPAFNDIIHYECVSRVISPRIYEGWNFNSGKYLFTTDTK